MNEKFHWQLSLLPHFGSSPAVPLRDHCRGEHSPGSFTRSLERARVLRTYQQRRNLIRAVTCGSTRYSGRTIYFDVLARTNIVTNHHWTLVQSIPRTCVTVLFSCCYSVLLTRADHSLSAAEEWKNFWQWVWQTVWLCACLLLIFHFLATNATIMSKNKEWVSTATKARHVFAYRETAFQNSDNFTALASATPLASVCM